MYMYILSFLVLCVCVCVCVYQVVYSRLSDMDVLIHRLVDIKTALDSSAKDRTAGTDGLLPQLSSILNELQQVCLSFPHHTLSLLH